MSVMGVKIDKFDVPFCTSFRPKTIQDQLCYTVDPNNYKHKIDLKEDLSLSLFVNYNVEKELVREEIETVVEDDFVTIETIGRT